MFYMALLIIIGLGGIAIVGTVIAARKQPVNEVEQEPTKGMLRHPVRNNVIIWSYILFPVIIIAGALLLYLVLW